MQTAVGLIAPAAEYKLFGVRLKNPLIRNFGRSPAISESPALDLALQSLRASYFN